MFPDENITACSCCFKDKTLSLRQVTQFQGSYLEEEVDKIGILSYFGTNHTKELDLFIL